ncbi:MAG: putative Peptidase, family [Cyanobacteria bacterium RYN_339]|nr:putative Peptidase, family [Cyanobacteria bacterium RYN_339]
MIRRGERPGFIGLTVGCLLGVFVLGCALIWLAWNGTFWLIDRAVDFVPPSWEEAFGQAGAAGEAKRAVADPVVDGAVQQIFGRLVKAAPADQPYHFHIQPIWSTQENAYALPGGQVLITSALLANAKSPDEVAGVLGHELQHVLGRHSFRAMAKKLGLAFVLSAAFGDQGLSGMIAEGSSKMLGLSFDRSQEWEADQVGVKLAHDAGYAPSAMADFFKRQMEESKLHPSAQQALALLSDHPADADRLAQIYKLAGEMTPVKHQGPAVLAAWQVVRKHAAAIPKAHAKQTEN